MKLTRTAIRYRPVVYVLTALIIIAGIRAYASLPRESAPEIKIPVVLVTVPYPGVSPKDIEALVIHPLERELKELKDVKELRSTSAEGAGVVSIEFEPDIDIDTAIQKVRDQVDRAEPDLPEDAEEPVITEISTEDFPVMIVTLSGKYGLVRLKQIAEDLQDEIDLVPGVLDVKLSGEIEREIQVLVHPERLAVYEVTMDDVISAVRSENVNLPGGTVDVGGSSYLVRVPADFQDASPIPDLVVKVKEGLPVYVRDVAEVVDGYKERGSYARINQTDSISLTITKRSGTNLLNLAEAVRAKVDDAKPGWPQGTTVTILNDQSEDIRDMVHQLENNMVTGLILVIGVLFFFLGLRNSLFVATAIPLSMLITFVVLQAIGFTLNMIVLFSLILALGMLVDNAIVIVENIYRHMSQGKNRARAAFDGTSEVAWPVITSTLTTVAAFAPLLFWPGIPGKFMGFLPRTVIIALLSSLFVALVINPVLCASFMKVRPGDEGTGEEDAMPRGWLADAYRRTVEWVLWRQPGVRRSALRHGVAPLLGLVVIFLAVGPLSMAMGRLGLPVAALLGLGVFAAVWVLVMRDNRQRVIFAMVYALVTTALVYVAFDHGVEFFPETTPESAQVTLRAADGANLDYTDTKVRDLEGFLAGQDNVENYVSTVGGAAAAGALNVGQSISNRANINIDFLDEQSRVESPYDSIERIRERARKIPGVEVEVSRPRMGPPVGDPVSLELRGDDLTRLGRLAQRIRDRLATVPGLVDLKDDYQAARPELRVEVDRVKAKLAGVSTFGVANTVRTAINGQEASTLRDGVDEYDIVVRLPKDLRQDPRVLERLTIPDKDGIPVPLTQVARIDTAGGTGSIRHKDSQRVITVSGDVQGRLPAEVLTEVQERLAGFELPDGYSITYAGEQQESQEASAFLSQAFLVALFVIFMILVAQFNSVPLPAIILISVVLSLIGVFAGLTLTARPFGIIMTGLGVISLAGIVVNNAIVLIDFIQQLRARGYDKREAIVRAGTIRLRPVLLTAITTLLGLLPMAVGVSIDVFELSVQVGGGSAEFWGSMAVAVVFGLTVSTFLTLVVVPALYSLFDDLSAWARRVFQVEPTRDQLERKSQVKKAQAA